MKWVVLICVRERVLIYMSERVDTDLCEREGERVDGDTESGVAVKFKK